MNTDQIRWRFPNGYGASCIEWRGGFEVAVLAGERLCYSTPLTSDVERFTSWADVVDFVLEISKLPASPTTIPATTERGNATESESAMKVPATVVTERRADQLQLGDQIMLTNWMDEVQVRTVVGLKLLNDDVEISTAPGGGECWCSISVPFHVVTVR